MNYYANEVHGHDNWLKKHKNTPLCIGSRVKANYEWITSWMGAWLESMTSEYQSCLSSPTVVSSMLTMWPWPCRQKLIGPSWMVLHTGHNIKLFLMGKIHHSAAYTWRRQINILYGDKWRRHETMFSCTGSRVNANYLLKCPKICLVTNYISWCNPDNIRQLIWFDYKFKFKFKTISWQFTFPTI